MKKYFYLIGLALSVLLPVRGQLISDFSTLGGVNYGGSWTSAITFNSGVATVGSPALADGNFEFADISAGTISLNTSLILNYTARVDSGNLSNSFVVRFADSAGNYSLQAVIVTTSWVIGQNVTGTAVLTSSGSGSASDSTYFTVTGDGSANAFRMSFDNLSTSAVPEPATYAALFGMASLGFVAWRKRRAA